MLKFVILLWIIAMCRNIILTQRNENICRKLFFCVESRIFNNHASQHISILSGYPTRVNLWGKINFFATIGSNKLAITPKIGKFRNRIADCNYNNCLDVNVSQIGIPYIISRVRDIDVDSQITLKIRTIFGRIIELGGVSKCCTIKDLKKQIYCQHGIDVKEQKLIIDGNVLADDHTIEDYELNVNGLVPILSLALRGGLSLKIKTMTGKVLEFEEINENDTVENLKKKIYEKEGIPPEEQRLVLKGKQMQNHLTIKEYELNDGSEIFLVLRLRGG